MRRQIEANLTSALQFKSPPKSWSEDKAQAFLKDVTDLLENAAPSSGFSAWLGQVHEKMRLLPGKTYPDLADFAKIAGAASVSVSTEEKSDKISATERSFRIYCERVVEGVGGVPDHWIFSEQATRGLREGRFTFEQMAKVQWAFFRQYKRVWGEEKAWRTIKERSEVAYERMRREAKLAPDPEQGVPHAADKDLEEFK